MTAADPAASLALLRRQVAALLSQIDTATLPTPDKVHGRRSDHPGHEWAPARGWRMFTIDADDPSGCVYIDHACDDINYRWCEPGDWEALRIEDARRIGLAFLAAAHHAEQLLATTTTVAAVTALRTGEHRHITEEET